MLRYLSCLLFATLALWLTRHFGNADAPIAFMTFLVAYFGAEQMTKSDK